ncbi:MAG: RNA 2',3'-cyclic phosphodiesterase [Clostridia bacterium]|nr:RNA 2',3'-cyclic phosphodiesterase [Clostridia bacterium]
MRLFVAIEFPQELKDALASVITSLKEQGARANFTRRENMHLTLAFIGETPRLADAKAALDTVKAAPFRVALEGSGAFGDVFWVGAHHNPDMQRLAGKVRDALRAAGFTLDPKPFKPHITIARRLDCPGKPEVDVPKESAFVTEFVLMRSDRVDGRLVYTPVHRVPLSL